MAPRIQEHTLRGDENQPFPHTANLYTYVPVDPFKPSIAFSLKKLSAEEDTNLLEDNRPPIRQPHFHGSMTAASRFQNQSQRSTGNPLPAQQAAPKPAWRTIPRRYQQASARPHIPDINSERDERRLSPPARYNDRGRHTRRYRSSESSLPRDQIDHCKHHGSSAASLHENSTMSSRMSGGSDRAGPVGWDFTSLPTVGPSVPEAISRPPSRTRTRLRSRSGSPERLARSPLPSQLHSRIPDRYQSRTLSPQMSVDNPDEIEYGWGPSRYSHRRSPIHSSRHSEDRMSPSPSHSFVVSPARPPDEDSERYDPSSPHSRPSSVDHFGSRVADDALSANTEDDFCRGYPESGHPNLPSLSQQFPPDIEVSVYGSHFPGQKRTSVSGVVSRRERSRSPMLRTSRTSQSCTPVPPIVSYRQPILRPPVLLADSHPPVPGLNDLQQSQKDEPYLKSFPSPCTNSSPWSSTASMPLRRHLELKLSTSYAAAFLIDTLPRQIYLNLLLRLPYLYFSRVTRIFEEAEMSMPMIRQGILEAARANAKARGESGFFGESAQARMLGGGAWGVELEPSTDNVGYINLQTTWLAFIDALLKEWKTLNIISVLLLSAILTILQIESAASDPLTRYTALLSMICALISLVYGCIYIIRFGTMKKTYKGAAWAQEAQRQKTGIWWNIWVMLALPATWLAWSVILYIMTIVAFVWRTSPFQSPALPTVPPSSISPQLLVPRLLITIVVSMGIIYFVLIASTLQRYGETMDRAWQERIWAWMQNAYEPEVVGVVDVPRKLQSWESWKPAKSESKEDVLEKDSNRGLGGRGLPENMSRDIETNSIPSRWEQPQDNGHVVNADKKDILSGDRSIPLDGSTKLPPKQEGWEKNDQTCEMTTIVNHAPNTTVIIAMPVTASPGHNFSKASHTSRIVKTSDNATSNHDVRIPENIVGSDGVIAELSTQNLVLVPCLQDRKTLSSPSSEADIVVTGTRPEESPHSLQSVSKPVGNIPSTQLATPTRTLNLPLPNRSVDRNTQENDLPEELPADDLKSSISDVNMAVSSTSPHGNPYYGLAASKQGSTGSLQQLETPKLVQDMKLNDHSRSRIIQPTDLIRFCPSSNPTLLADDVHQKYAPVMI